MILIDFSHAKPQHVISFHTLGYRLQDGQKSVVNYCVIPGEWSSRELNCQGMKQIVSILRLKCDSNP